MDLKLYKIRENMLWARYRSWKCCEILQLMDWGDSCRRSGFGFRWDWWRKLFCISSSWQELVPKVFKDYIVDLDNDFFFNLITSIVFRQLKRLWGKIFPSYTFLLEPTRLLNLKKIPAYPFIRASPCMY